MMTADPITVGPMNSAEHAGRLISERKHKPPAGVDDEGRLVGVVTGRRPGQPSPGPDVRAGGSPDRPPRPCGTTSGGWKSRLDQRVELCPVLKADAYGHGSLHCVGAVAEAGADRIAFATASEAVLARSVAPDIPMLVVGASPG